jgi:hypothetical protein
MVSVNLSDELVEQAKIYAGAYSRSTPKQIEHWAKIGRMLEDNPDLTYEFAQDILIAMQQKERGEVEPYVFGTEGHKDG